MSDTRDRELGMRRRITRRDFLNGIAIGTGSAMLLPDWVTDWARVEAAPAGAASDYPPGLTGLRGSHQGSFEVLHRLKDGRFWAAAGKPEDTREHYDLAIVGAGISGLAAAYYFRQAAGPNARVIVLDNHDDFGGHAKRNEFSYRGRTYVGYGGTQSIDSPAPYSETARAFITGLGIDVSRYSQYVDSNLYRSLGLRPGFFFDRETYGVDRLVAGSVRRPDDEFLAASPLKEETRRDLKRVFAEAFDPMPGLSSDEKKARLARMSYADFLLREWKLVPGVVQFLQTRTHGLFGVGIDAVPAQDAWGLGLPGFQAMQLDAKPGPGQNYDSIRHESAEGYYFHFPDGSATIARLLVRTLIPAAVPGETADDVVSARVNYARLDRQGAPVRIRLSSSVVAVRHEGDPDGTRGVEVLYVRGNTLKRVRARAAVLACWHTVIPFLCPEMPEPQRKALAYAIKVPLVYTNVFIRNWTSFQKLGVNSVSSPGLWHQSVSLDAPVSIGAYRCPRSPDEPIVLHLSKSACKPGLPARAQHQAGRAELLSTPFATVERGVRDQLARILGGGGFDPARDMLGLTVNRWPHGYAYQYNSLEDPFWVDGGEVPCVVARQRFGRMAIANADAAAYAYTDAAIDHAHRAVREVLDLGS